MLVWPEKLKNLKDSPFDPRDAAAVDAAIETRVSNRAFAAKPVSPELVMEILRVASRAPSGTNTQPWKIYVLQGVAKDALVSKTCALHDAIQANPALEAEYVEEYDYYPKKWISPYIERRREVGLGLYSLLGIGKGEKEKMHQQLQRNYRFFDAPVGLMFTVDRIMGRGSLLDYGMFLQNIMVAARGRGLDTCPQAAWNPFAKLVLPHIGADPDEMLVCGMSLGYAQPGAKVNELYTRRVPVEEMTTWVAADVHG
jgi:nitroreductase